MSDLTVQLKYRHPLSDSLNTMSHVSFPLWGIVAPLMVLAGCFSYFFLPAYRPDGTAVASILSGLLLAGLGFRFSSFIGKSALRIEKSGIDLPNHFGTAFSSTFVPWNSIAKIEAPAENPERPRLVFYTKGHGSRTIECWRFTGPELEQLLLAIQLWSSEPSVDSSVKTLQETIKTEALLEDKQNLGPSYTALWDDELHRRFRQVAFIPLEPSTVIRNGTLTVVRQLAMGGLSAIYLCQLDQQELVIVKEAVTPNSEGNAELKKKAQELFDREAQLLMRLSHPKIVKVLDHFVQDNRSYMMMEYVKGQDLRQYVKQNGSVREALVADWAKEIASVLSYLHGLETPVVHRDLTPDNIVVKDDGSIVVIDFGAANEYLGNSTGTFVGKQCYISPEQFRGKAVPQSDIYAFGGTLHFLLTGSDPKALSASHPREANSMVSEPMDTLVADCTALDTERRIKTAEDLTERLKLISVI
ncbi:MAG TPA: serine/threonine-protein kinase [Oculatellaceae cyanobacterium]